MNFDMTHVLPVAGSAGQLLAAAIRAPAASSLTRLGEDAGLSKFAASRAGRQLLDAGLLIQVDRGYRFDSDHPLADLALTVVRTLTGVTPYRHPEVGDAMNGLADDGLHSREIPASLRRPGPDLDDRAFSQVTVLQARVLIEQLSELVAFLLEAERLCHDVFARWGSERLRDAVHLTMRLGDAAIGARTTLLTETSPRLQSAAPDVATVSVWAWARASYLVNAEFQRIARVVKLFEESAELGRTFHARREQLIDEALSVGRTGGQIADWQLQGIVDKAAEAEELWASSTGRLHHVGGMPGRRDFGGTGDQFLAVYLNRLGDRCRAMRTSMTEDSAFSTWQENYRAEAEQHPIAH